MSNTVYSFVQYLCFKTASTCVNVSGGLDLRIPDRMSGSVSDEPIRAQDSGASHQSQASIRDQRNLLP